MPVSRCARLKNDRRGAKPDSTLSSFSLPLLSSLVFCRLDSSAIVSSLSLRQRRAVPLSSTHSKIKTASPRRSNHWSFFFYGSFFLSAFNLLLQDSLDSLGDYVSCYYSSREEHPRIPPPISASSVPSTPSMLLLFFGYRFIDLLVESTTRDKTSTVSITYTFTKTKVSLYVAYLSNTHKLRSHCWICQILFKFRPRDFLWW